MVSVFGLRRSVFSGLCAFFRVRYSFFAILCRSQIPGVTRRGVTSNVSFLFGASRFVCIVCMSLTVFGVLTFSKLSLHDGCPTRSDAFDRYCEVSSGFFRGGGPV